MKKRILVVDDSATARIHIVRELSDEFDCLAASNGTEALALMTQSKPHAVVTDLEMSSMRGTELLRALKGDLATKSIPVIVVTSKTEVQEMNACLSLGCAGFVLKPVDGSYLRAKLRRLFAVA